MNRDTFAHAVRVAQARSFIEREDWLTQQAINWLTADMQRQLIALLLTAPRPLTAVEVREHASQFFNEKFSMGQAFSLTIGVSSEGDRAARKSPPVVLHYLER